MVASSTSVGVAPREPSSALFSAHRHRASKAKKSVAHVAKAVVAVMRRELGDRALERWQELIDAELGEPLFGTLAVAKSPPRPKPLPAAKPLVDPSSWAPSKPKLTALVLDAIGRGLGRVPYDGPPMVMEASMSLGTARRSLSKLMLKRAIDWLMTHRAQNIRTSGEIRPDQLEDRVRTYRAVVRAATDALSYLHAAAIASTASTGEHEDDEDAVLYLQTADDRLGGENVLIATCVAVLIIYQSARLWSSTIRSEAH